MKGKVRSRYMKEKGGIDMNVKESKREICMKGEEGEI